MGHIKGYLQFLFDTLNSVIVNFGREKNAFLTTFCNKKNMLQIYVVKLNYTHICRKVMLCVFAIRKIFNNKALLSLSGSLKENFKEMCTSKNFNAFAEKNLSGRIFEEIRY